MAKNMIKIHSFSKETQSYIETFPINPLTNQLVISEDQRNSRVDLTKKIIFTIDPKTSKDMDDALSIERMENGNWDLGVHITDVSYFVTPGSPLDIEAIKRSTSHYLPL